MITKINCELDSLETAELAARMIKQKTNGIINIKIEKNAAITEKEHTPYAIPAFSNNSTYVFLPVSIDYSPFSNNIDNKNNYSSHETSRSVILEVICENEEEKTVSQVFTSLGGLKINKN